MPDISVHLTLCDDEPDEFAVTITLKTDRHANLPDIIRAVRDVDLSHVIFAGLACTRPGDELEFTV